MALSAGRRVIMADLSSWSMRISTLTIWNRFCGPLLRAAIPRLHWMFAAGSGATRSIRACRSTRKKSRDYTGSVAIIDACRPYHWIDEFPATTQISEELLKETNAKWGKFIGED